MGKNNVQLLALAKTHLGQGGSLFRKFCGMSGGAWCCAYVTYMFHEGNDSPLFYGGKKVVYCPTAIQWCKAHLAQIPIYLALPMDIIFFDWNNNNVPDHIGFVRERKTDQDVYTIEGNTSGGIVAEKTRPNKYVLGCFRPAFKANFDASKPLEIDGYFGYNSIACLQKALKKSGHYTDSIDGILGKNTVKALQKKAGVAQDGSWGVKTSKAVQKMVGAKVDGAFGAESTKKLQEWINKQNSVQSNGQKIAEKATELAYAGSPKEAKYPSGHAKEAYKKALDAVYPNRSSWGKAPKAGASCDVYVGTCVRASGVDPSFPRGLKEQIAYLPKALTFSEIPYKKDNLKAGDIIVYKRKNAGSHILIVANSKKHLCEANLNSTYGITRTTDKGINYRLKTSNKEWIRAYRAR